MKSRDLTYRGIISKLSDTDLSAALNQGVYYGLSGLECQVVFVDAVNAIAAFRGSVTFREKEYWLSHEDINTPMKKAFQAMTAILAARLKSTDPDNSEEWEYLETVSRKYIIEEG